MKRKHLRYSYNPEFNMEVLLEIIFPDWNSKIKDEADKKYTEENKKDGGIEFQPIEYEEFNILDKITSNHPLQYLNENKYIRENITIDRNNYYSFLLKSIGCPHGPIKSSKEKTITLENIKKVYRYYLVKVNFDNLPPFLYENKEKKNANSNWWLSQYDLMIFDMFNCKYELNTTENINCYYYDKIVTTKHSILEKLIKLKNENKCNRIIKGYMNCTIGQMQRKRRVDDEMPS